LNDRSLIRWLVLVVVIIALLNLPAGMSDTIKSAFREAARPLQYALDSAWGSVAGYTKSVGRIPGLLVENESLRQEVARLTTERNHLRTFESENEQFRQLLRLRPRPETDWITAQVLSRSHDGWWQTVRLNKGSSEGIAENMAVVSAEGLVGRIVAVSRNTADVLLLSDPAFKVSTRLIRTGSFGVVSGRGPSWQGQVYCRMEFIHKNDEIKPGDEVVTSGLGGVFPESIAIGYVDRVYMDPSGLYQHADIITRADLSSLQYVFVMRQDGLATGGVGP
jgi:rod shape-determining protein MreC